MSEGVGVGVLTGLVGVGGGFAIVPALVLLGKVPMRKAIGTSLVIIGLNAIAGLAGYWGRLSLPWDLTLTFAACAGLGTLLGSAVSQRISTQRLQKSFAIFLLAIGGFVLARSVL
nr:sulfite exporter TauE/SafE family protein [Synechococcus elongatus]